MGAQKECGGGGAGALSNCGWVLAVAAFALAAARHTRALAKVTGTVTVLEYSLEIASSGQGSVFTEQLFLSTPPACYRFTLHNPKGLCSNEPH